MATLTTTIQDMMTPSLLGRLASDSGLPESKVKTGITGAIASIFDGLAGKASDTRTMGRVAELISRGPDVDVDHPERLMDDASPARSTGKELLDIAAPDTGGLISRLASALGIGGKAAGGLVAGAASLLFAAFRKLSRQRGPLDASSLASILHEERRDMHAAVPTGLATAAAPRPRTYEGRREEVHREPARSRGWAWLLALIPLALIGFWLFNRARTDRTIEAPATAPLVREEPTVPERPVTPEPPSVAPAPTPPPAEEPQMGVTPPAEEPAQPEPQAVQPIEPEPEPEPAQPSEPEAMAPTPPEEGELSYPAGSVEADLLSHVETEAGDDETTWFELEQVHFATGQATLDPMANEQIDNIAEIMKANSETRFLIGGFTDSTGSKSINQRLSLNRANAVRDALLERGVSPQQIVTKGFADQRKIDQTTGESEVNRRVAVRVLSRAEEG